MLAIVEDQEHPLVLQALDQGITQRPRGIRLNG